jgi:hypothetical protein
MAWSIQGGRKTAASRPPGRFRGGRQQGLEWSGMAGSSDTLRNPWNKDGQKMRLRYLKTRMGKPLLTGASVLTFLLIYLLTYWLFDLPTFWPTNLSTYWPTDLLTYRPTDPLTYCSFDLLTFWPTELLTYWPFDLLTFWPTDLEGLTLRSWPLEELTPWGVDPLRSKAP